jgi:hypothetical protein
MRALLAIVCVCVCACASPQVTTVAVQQAATVLGGDLQPGATCASEAADCSPMGGGTGSLLLPIAVIGVAALVIASVSYVNYVVQKSARLTPPARHRTP